MTVPLLRWFKNIVKSVDDVLMMKNVIFDLYKELLSAILKYKDITVNRENAYALYSKTYYLLDQKQYEIDLYVNYFEYALYTSGNSELCEAIQSTLNEIHEFYITQIIYNHDMFAVLKDIGEVCKTEDAVLPIEKKYIDKILTEYKNKGIELSEEEKERLKKLNIEVNELAIQFEGNIREPIQDLCVTDAELGGLTESQKMKLRKEDNEYCLGVDYPTYQMIMSHCSNRETRKLLHANFELRGYPNNIGLFNEYRIKRDAIAKILGYDSYPDLDFREEMAKRTSTVTKFLSSVREATMLKAEAEKTRFDFFATKELFARVEEFVLEPYDVAYLYEQYKKKYDHIDSEFISLYFELQKTLTGMMTLFSEFFDISLERISYDADHADWTYCKKNFVVRVTERDGSIIGDILFDLFPRPGKYTHACQMNLVNPVYWHYSDEPQKLQHHPCNLIICNFNQNENGLSLLYFGQVETLFHEFGHAIHGLFGSSSYYAFSGNRVLSDFIEVPSQLLEFWLFEKDILRTLSSHYVTGEALPVDIINTVIRQQYFGMGLFFQRQASMAEFCLNTFFEPQAIFQEQLAQLDKRYIMMVPTRENFVSSFGHLVSNLYGPKYYSYLWSFLYALQFFCYIRDNGGLRDPKYGVKLRQEILSHGGNIDPTILCRNFLDGLSEHDQMRIFKSYLYTFESA